MIRDLWNGNVRLVIVYWVFAVMVGIIYNILAEIITANIIRITLVPLGQIFLYLFLAFPFIYFPFIFVAIWRSANKYTKSKGWTSLAKIAVCIGAFSLLISGINIAFELFSEKSLSNEEIKERIAIINKDLPQMIDSATEFSRVSFENNILYYNYKITENESFRIDKNKFIDIDKSIITNVCNNSFFKSIFAGGGSAVFIYEDKEGNIVNKAVINRDSCQQ